MKKISVLLAMLLCFISVSDSFAVGKKSTAKNVGVKKTSSSTKTSRPVGDQGASKSDRGVNKSSGKTTKIVYNVSPDSVQGKVVAAAKNLAAKYNKPHSFPYSKATDGGKKGCAQVATTALKNAGVLNKTSLACLETKKMLLNIGWQLVKTPPFQAGDVIFWSTYDRNKDGKNDADTHVGIALASGNNVQAMSNSSSTGKPRLHDANEFAISNVLRKC